jgi:hypothetical protein
LGRRDVPVPENPNPKDIIHAVRRQIEVESMRIPEDVRTPSVVLPDISPCDFNSDITTDANYLPSLPPKRMETILMNIPVSEVIAFCSSRLDFYNTVKPSNFGRR